MLLVGSASPELSPFGRDETVAIQWLLYKLPELAGRVVLHGAAPARPMLIDHNPQLVAEWAGDLKAMLPAAGILACEPRGRVIGPATPDPEELEVFSTVLKGYETKLPPGLTELDGAQHHDLVWDGAHALVTVVDHWTVIHAGSTANPEDRSGVQSCIAAKRADMLANGVLQRTRCGGLLRFTCDTAVPSLTNAIRVITGTNLPKDHFRVAA